MIRIPDPGRFELRLMDGSANPYLLQASVLAAGLYGLKNKIDPGEPLTCNMYTDYKKYPNLPKLPNERQDSLELLKNNKEMNEAFGKETINSYRRINAPPTKSGASWSPSSISYTGNNRTHMIRIPDPGRFELRLMDGSANPYLLQASVLAAGLYLSLIHI